MGELEDQFRAEAAIAEELYQTFKAGIQKSDPELAHVLFDVPICAQHEVPVDQCKCP